MPGEENASLKRKYELCASEERRKSNQAQAYADVCIAQKTQAENKLYASKLEKKNLEARLEEVKRIIKMFDGDVTTRITKANRSAQSAGEKYSGAIQCTFITSASIETVFHTKTVFEDDYLMSAYQSCTSEKNRLENAIESLRQQMNSLNNIISSLNSSIHSYTNTAYNCSLQASLYSRKAGLL